jgi:hypothetical protein
MLRSSFFRITCPSSNPHQPPRLASAARCKHRKCSLSSPRIKRRAHDFYPLPNLSPCLHPQGTSLVSGVLSVIHKYWDEGLATTLRGVVLVTDGISTDANNTAPLILNALHSRSANMSVVHVTTPRYHDETEMAQRLRLLETVRTLQEAARRSGGLYMPTKGSPLFDLPARLTANLLTALSLQALPQGDSEWAGYSCQALGVGFLAPPSAALALDAFEDMMQNITRWSGNQSTVPTLATLKVSPLGWAAFSANDTQQQEHSRACSRHRAAQVTASRLALQAQHASLLQRQSRFVADAQSRLRRVRQAVSASGLTERLWVTLSEHMEFTRFTRYRTAPTGTSLDLEAVRRSIVNQQPFADVFRRRTEGGVREHASCVLFDRSLSMFWQPALATMTAGLGLLDALEGLGTHTCVITFGNTVRLVKLPSSQWSDVEAASFVAELALRPQDVEMGTNAGAAVDFAVEVLLGTDTRYQHIFVLTDGYSSAPGGLPMSIAGSRAEQTGISVIGVGVGVGKLGLAGSFNQWVHVASPLLLPQALQELYLQGKGVLSPFALGDHGYAPELSEVEAVRMVTSLSAAEDLAAADLGKKYFPVVSYLREQAVNESADLVASANEISVGVCFMVDLSGSNDLYFSLFRDMVPSGEYCCC